MDMKVALKYGLDSAYPDSLQPTLLRVPPGVLGVASVLEARRRGPERTEGARRDLRAAESSTANNLEP